MDALGVSETSENGAESTGVVAADHGSTKYSVESVVDTFAGKFTHPESVAGSSDW
jgi:hypothetical protein